MWDRKFASRAPRHGTLYWETVCNDSQRSDEESHRQAAEFTRRLLEWHAQTRRDLPWRRTRDPYAIWISETMLQQTQVATVIPYWTRWLERFPDVRALAEAPIDDVLKAWQGLGYYARARNLHKAAQAIVEKHGGVFPTDFDDVLALPGVGRYTAGAICSIALGQDVPIVDANVIRVLCRVFGITGDPKSSATQKRLWELAAALIPPGSARLFNEGMMELGALICQSAPRCAVCPMQDICVAYASGNPASLPQFAPKPAFTTETHVSAIIRRSSADDRVLVVRRAPGSGLWGGLWEFPRAVQQAGNETTEQAAERAAQEAARLSVRAVSSEPAALVRHGVTTRRITLIGIECQPESPEREPQPSGDCDTAAWVTLDELDGYALASPQVKLLSQLKEGKPRQTALPL